MLSRWKLSFAPLLSLALVAACAAPQADDADDPASSEDAIVASTNAAERAAVERTNISSYTFDHITPIGTHLFKGAVYWRDHQIEDLRYPVARMCASNVSKVLFLGGVQRYNAEGVYALIRSVGDQGGETHRLPRPTKDANGLPRGSTDSRRWRNWPLQDRSEWQNGFISVARG